MTNTLWGEGGGAVVTVGTFDGVHLGHWAILREIAERARRTGRRSVLVTFEPHPLDVVNPPAAPPRLTVGDERREILAQGELDLVVFVPFTRTLSRYAPEQFVRWLVDRFALQELVIGHDHGFGRARAGDEGTLRRLGAALGFGVDVIDEVVIGPHPVSSTMIRRAVAGGDLALARRLLGRPYSVVGTVVPGAGRGRELGIRTINLEVADPRKLLPPTGVYAVQAEWRDGAAGGMLHFGPRPTFGETERTLEVHLFDVDVDLYDYPVKISWGTRLRDVKAFDGIDGLRAQLARDREAANRALTAWNETTSH